MTATDAGTLTDTRTVTDACCMATVCTDVANDERNCGAGGHARADGKGRIGGHCL